MKKIITVLTLCGTLFALCLPAEAQQPTKIPRVGFLAGTKPAPVAARVAAFRQGLRELGYVEGKNIIVEYRYAEGKADRERELAAELARLKEIVPKLSLVTVIGSSNEPDNPQILKEMELAAGALKVKLQYLDVLSSKDIETAFQAAAKTRADGVVMLGSVVFNTHRIQIVELAVKSRLPATYTRPEYVEDGGLMTYGPSINDLFRRAATYVDKILKGAKPADLAVEQPKK